MIDEGYVKYQCNWVHSSPLHPDNIKELNQWRDKLYRLGLVGQYDNGIGFGNVSIRYSEPGQFIISGTQTGHLYSLSEHHYTKVINFDLEQNFLTCLGPIQASSESLTHAAIYEINPAVNAIFHVHNFEMWKQLMNNIPTTSKDCDYGTPEMAKEIIRLFKEEELMDKRILVMGGHEEGIISFGKNLKEAGDVLLSYTNSL